MRFISKQLIFMVVLICLLLALGILFLLTIKAKRSSRLYRLRLALVGALVALLGGVGMGCHESTGKPDGTGGTLVECYVAPWDPGLEEPSSIDGETDDVVLSECYVYDSEPLENTAGDDREVIEEEFDDDTDETENPDGGEEETEGEAETKEEEEED